MILRTNVDNNDISTEVHNTSYSVITFQVSMLDKFLVI